LFCKDCRSSVRTSDSFFKRFLFHFSSGKKKKDTKNRDLWTNQFNQFSISSTRTKLNRSLQSYPSLSFYPKENPFQPVSSVPFPPFSKVCSGSFPELVLRLSSPSRIVFRLFCSFVKMCQTVPSVFLPSMAECWSSRVFRSSTFRKPRKGSALRSAASSAPVW